MWTGSVRVLIVFGLWCLYSDFFACIPILVTGTGAGAGGQRKRRHLLYLCELSAPPPSCWHLALGGLDRPPRRLVTDAGGFWTPPTAGATSLDVHPPLRARCASSSVRVLIVFGCW